MKKLDTFHALRCWADSPRPAIAFVLLLAAGNISSLFATNPRYIYKGTDSGNGITVNLTVEPIGSFASVTGSIYDAEIRQAGDRIVEFYRGWQKPDLARKWEEEMTHFR